MAAEDVVDAPDRVGAAVSGTADRFRFSFRRRALYLHVVLGRKGEPLGSGVWLCLSVVVVFQQEGYTGGVQAFGDSDCDSCGVPLAAPLPVRLIVKALNNAIDAARDFLVLVARGRAV